MARALALAALAAVGLSACGNRTDERQVRRVVAGFYDAVRRQDGRGACARLSLATAQQLEGQTGKTCREVVTKLDYRGGAVTRVEVYLDSARADLRNGETAFLDREANGWRLSALACQESSKPADQPFDCQVES